MSFYRLILPAKVEDLTDPRGLPYWRDRSLYPKPGALSLAQWRWEFLRRDASYQAAWGRCMIDPHRNTIKSECRRFYLARLIEPRLSAQRVPVQDVTFNDHMMRIEDERYACGAAMQWISTEFGRMPLHLHHREVAELLAEATHSKYFLAIIRPNDALEPQLDAIKKRVATLTRKKAKNTRNRARNYPVYLRLLDARTRNPRASWNEIAKTLEYETKSGMNKDGARSLHDQALARQEQMVKSPQIA